MAVLILSHPDEDAHVQRMVAELDKLGYPWFIFDPGAFSAQISFEASLSSERKRSTLTFCEKHICLEDITSVWYRRPRPIAGDETLPPLERLFIERESKAGVWGWLRGLEAFWVNPVDAIRAAGHKPHQLQLAQKVGLAVPRTLITNSPEAFLAFYEECHGNVIYKLMGYPWYIDEGGIPLSLYTTRVPRDMIAQAHRVSACAHLFQEFIEKRCDLRAILIGNEVFTVEIYGLTEETYVDFRVDYSQIRYAPHCLPDQIREALLAMNRAYSLVYSAIDLVFTAEGQYIFLELNPVGQFGWLDRQCGVPLYRTLADLLVKGTW
ncbi:glutathione synthase/RimK-type ligase-like ATP-grasp enzyme [Thermosporothrix hazakensis]|jgi:hypothetical protein|uniref:Glutathione synthase/RimK-type ligase-like ATP-grasp enzyme n=2 Tax=Thermosporothrix TaxID=768650 RepID=A0A326TU08_THEHA|nr:hypothetical protein [Thermosporothrix hazakensis]PZW19348.1 glutathione synthase/RimK-type ligase-like ATP-grasp enzyme [Thermosporothrix hazakensis]BBH91799.1 ATP-grasp ribosomal peptide maturase [Thermosporothrix sp. COM3]GCE49901.1 ATP-grasp ribosomal peptide maturase [Thermosporothrix hazakensis]